MKMEKLAVRLFYLWLFLLPWQTRWLWRHGEINGEQWEYGNLGVFATEILLWSVVMLFLVGGGWQKIKSDFLLFCRRPFTRFWFLLGTALLAINIAVAENHLLAVQQWRFWLEAAFIAYLFWRLAVSKTLALKYFLSGLAIQAGLALWQFFVQETFASRFLGLTQHLPWTAGSAVLENSSGLWMRAYGGLPHPNVLGGYLAAGLLLFLAWISVEKEKIRRGWFWLAGVLLGGLMVSFSRSAVLALLVAGSLLLIHSFKLLVNSGAYPIWRRLTRFSALLLALAALCAIILWPLVSGRLTARDRLEQWSIAERQSGVQLSTQIIKKHFWLGTGMGNYTLAVAQAEKPLWMTSVKNYQPAHNVVLLGLAEIGVLFFVYVLAFLAMMCRLLTGARRRLLSALGAFVLCLAMIDHYLFSLYSGIMLATALICFFVWLVDDYEHFPVS